MKKLLYFLMVLSIVFVFGTICYADSYETEPNNDKSQANALVSGVPIIGQLSLKTDQDWFYVCTSAADLITVKFSLDPDPVIGTFFYISIEDSLGNVLGNKNFFVYPNMGYPDKECTLSSAVTSPGIYYVVISTSGSTGFDTNYTLTTSISNPGECPTEPSQYETEPNNDKSQANALVSDVPIIGQCSSGDDDDWFYLCTSGADLIETTFGIEAESSYRGFIISIEDVHGNLLSEYVHSGNDATESTLNTAVTAAGIYYIKIDSSNTEAYSLTASISNPGECPTEPPQYDVTGIWQMVGQNYYLSLYITGSTAIAVTYIPGAGESYLLGTISGNIGHINYSSDLAQFDATFTFTSATTGTLTVNKCVPFSGEYCILPVGVPISGVKIF